MPKVHLILLVILTCVFSIAANTQKIKIATQEPPIIFPNDEKIEPSAVEPIGNGTFLLVADDKDIDGKSLKVVEAKTGKVLKTLDKIQPTKKNPKWEAMAKDEAGNYFIIGSHFEETDPEKLASRSLMFKFRLKDEMEQDGTKIEIDNASIKELDAKESLTSMGLHNQTPANNKGKIEGLTIRTIGNQKELFIGLREPSDFVQVYSAVIPDDELQKTSLFKLDLKLFLKFDAGKTTDNTQYKLSSIEFSQDFNGFLILTSTETTDSQGKPIFHGNALWFASIKSIEKARTNNLELAKVQKVFEFKPTMKVEGLCLFSNHNNNDFRGVLVYDNDTKDSGLAGKMQFINLTLKN
ncbi:MAG: hypothetical protein K1X72_08125 [Pyrinomonadaceae bacterium]|nr:hypothetical protein [Pyrinomonadaceae bacterium]